MSQDARADPVQSPHGHKRSFDTMVGNGQASHSPSMPMTRPTNTSLIDPLSPKDVWPLDLLPSDVILDGVATYFKCLHNQPYTLFGPRNHKDFRRQCGNEILLPMLALSIRCSKHDYWSNRSKMFQTSYMAAEHTWNILQELYWRSKTSLSYLQGLCLLAQVDFASKPS